MEWHGAIAIYVIGTLALIISAVHTAVTSRAKGTLMNGFELEKNLALDLLNKAGYSLNEHEKKGWIYKY